MAGQREEKQFAIPLFDEDEKPEENVAVDDNGEENDSDNATPESEPEGKQFYFEDLQKNKPKKGGFSFLTG